MAELLPKKWKSFLSISVHFQQSITIPIYRSPQYWEVQPRPDKTAQKKVVPENKAGPLEQITSKDFWETEELAQSVKEFLEENYDQEDWDDLLDTDEEELTEIMKRTSKRRRVEEDDDDSEDEEDEDFDD